MDIEQKLIVHGELTDLNTYMDAERTNRFIAAKIKKYETARVAGECREQRLKPMTKVNLLVCTWYAKDQRKDTDNIEFSKKFIMDGIVDARVLPRDSRKHTGSTTHHHDIDAANPRVEIVLQGHQ